MLAKPAKVPSLGARSGGVGNLASAGARKASVTPVDGKTVSSPPDASLARSGAVSAARSRSIGHLNLSQPLGSSAAQAGATPNSNNATSSDVRMSVHRDHDVGGLHHDGNLAAGLDAEIVDRVIGDRRGDDLAAADIDADTRRRRAFLHFDDAALDLVACTDAHAVLTMPSIRGRAARCWLFDAVKDRDRRPCFWRSAYGVATAEIIALLSDVDTGSREETARRMLRLRIRGRQHRLASRR